MTIDQELRDQLKRAHHVVALTGAGMSQESGLPTFRDSADGLWNQYVAEEVATANALRSHPQKVWEWHQQFSRKIGEAVPNAGHLALAQLEQGCKVTVVTQNVDDLHERAGSSDVVHLHGNAFAYRCTACSRPMNVPADLMNDWVALRDQVRCEHCNGHARHDVVLFNEMLDRSRIALARKAIRDCDVVLVVGTSNLIYPAAELPHYAMKRKKYLVEINPIETSLSNCVSVRINALAAATLEDLISR